jgi:hypothetical protein
MRPPGLTPPLFPGRSDSAGPRSESGAIQARTPHVWPGLYASAAFLEWPHRCDGMRLAYLHARAVAVMPVATPAGRASVAWHVIAGRPGSPDRALPKLPKAYGAADWATAQAYSARGLSLEGYLAETFHRPDGNVHVHLQSMPSPQCCPKGHHAAQIVTEVTPAFQPPTTGWSSAVLRDRCDRQRRVRISRWLLHEFPHTGSHTRRATTGEIYPVTRLEVWDDDHHAWQLIPEREGRGHAS